MNTNTLKALGYKHDPETGAWKFQLMLEREFSPTSVQMLGDKKIVDATEEIFRDAEAWYTRALSVLCNTLATPSRTLGLLVFAFLIIGTTGCSPQLSRGEVVMAFQQRDQAINVLVQKAKEQDTRLEKLEGKKK